MSRPIEVSVDGRVVWDWDQHSVAIEGARTRENDGLVDRLRRARVHVAAYVRVASARDDCPSPTARFFVAVLCVCAAGRAPLPQATNTRHNVHTMRWIACASHGTFCRAPRGRLRSIDASSGAIGRSVQEQTNDAASLAPTDRRGGPGRQASTTHPTPAADPPPYRTTTHRGIVTMADGEAEARFSHLLQPIRCVG